MAKDKSTIVNARVPDFTVIDGKIKVSEGLDKKLGLPADSLFDKKVDGLPLIDYINHQLEKKEFFDVEINYKGLDLRVFVDGYKGRVNVVSSKPKAKDTIDVYREVTNFIC